MTLEATLDRIATALETIAKNGGTLTQVAAELGAPEPAATPAPAPEVKTGKGRKAAATSTETATADTATAAASSTPTQTSAPASAPAAEGPKWEDVIAKITTLNKGKPEDGQGRPAVVAVLKQFGLDPEREKDPQTVPALKPMVDRYAEIIKAIEARLAPKVEEPAGEIDLGI